MIGVQVSSRLRCGESEYFWYCPGCDEMHPLPGGWTFDGDLERPTFEPSFKHDWTRGSEHERRVCHYSITRGEVQFYADSTHRLAGQTMPMPELPPEYRDK